MKRFPLTLPAVGSTYPFKIDGATTLRTIESIDLGRGLMFLVSNDHPLRPTFINDVVRMVRPNDAAAWLPVLREHYTMSDEGRAALISEANPCPIDTDLMEAGENTDDVSRDLYATIGDPVPQLVWPRQECGQSPARGETTGDDAPIKVLESLVGEPSLPRMMRVEDFTVGERVVVAKKVETLSNGRSAGWESQWMDETVGETGHVVDVSNDRVLVRLDSDGCEWAYAPEALALENACSKVTKEPAPVDDAAPAKPHAFKAGDRVVVARKVERDSTGHWCFWPSGPSVLGALGVVLRADTDTGATIIVDLASFGPRCFSPEALDLMTVAQRPLKPGDKVRVARKVVTDSKGRDCDWDDFNMAQTIGTELVVSHVESVGDRDSIPVRLANGYWYSPEALDLIEPAT